MSRSKTSRWPLGKIRRCFPIEIELTLCDSSNSEFVMTKTVMLIAQMMKMIEAS